MTREEFIDRHNVEINNEDLIEIRYILSTVVQSLGTQDENLLVQHLPSQPLLVNIASSSKRGCSFYYKTLYKKKILNNKIHLRESKWHDEINGFLSLDFWQNSYRLVDELKFENKIKWLQFQIVRGCLQTNNTVHHFKPNVSPLWYYCGTINERILHLFFSCHTGSGHR